MHLDDSQVPTAQSDLPDGHRWWGQDVSLVPQVGEPPQQLVRDLTSGVSAIVCDTDEQHTGHAVTRQVVGEGTHRLARLVGIRRRFFAFDPIRLKVGQERRQFVAGEGHDRDLMGCSVTAGRWRMRLTYPD